MRNVFTTFASSRFIDRQAVVQALCVLAQRLQAQHAAIVAVHLFGSFATGAATPRSDADLVIEVSDSTDAACREHLMDAAQTVLAESPVPVDVFILASERMRQRRGVAAAVAREGMRLA